ncbi:hypothetical protein GGR28_000461 [Lewinella aquimaris]|uniref:YbbR-like domain-containing protein n=1 Tax=Neolewinella aquimaris TaxID=1835722 RepID=A0A840DY60_9BACT|nr:CdaR family protein [Neolewinella aquimaris]MBB4077860.1 hypothetical protein [Neolewinella aquimaris]
MATTDRQILLICIGLAFVFWLILNLSQDYEINKEVDISYVVSPDRVVAGTPPRTVGVQVRGRGWNLIWETLRGRRIGVDIDLQNQTELLLTGNLLQQQISRQLSSGDLEVDNLNYDAQRILTTPRDGKRVPVVSKIKVNFRPGYFASGNVLIEPDSITVSGSTDDLMEISSWPTEALVLENVEQDQLVSVPLQTPEEGLTINYGEVSVAVPVDAFIEQQIEVPVMLRNAPPADSSRVFPNVVTVTVTIPQSQYGLYNASDFRVEADLTGIRISENHNSLPLTLTRVPESIRGVNFAPKAVEYYVYRREQQ